VPAIARLRAEEAAGALSLDAYEWAPLYTVNEVRARLAR
jgi:hypothetical protein